MKRSRALLALMPVALVGALLTACSGPSTTSAIDGVDCAPEGEASKAIDIEGDFGVNELSMQATTPLGAGSLQRSVLIEGDGEAVAENDTIETQLTLFNGKSGELVSSEKAGVPLNANTQAWALESLACASVGDRILVVSPVSEVLGEGGGANYSLEDADNIVLVFDIQSSEPAPKEPGALEPDQLLEKAEGEAQEIPEGLPSVVLAEDGSPTITMPEGAAAPEMLTVQALIKGDGEEVQEGDRVYVHYRGVIWRTGEEFDSSWSRGAPTDFLTTGVIGGFSEALVGQTVGSQVMSIVPAEDGGYGGDQLAAMGHDSDDVMVFVLDILGTAHAQ